MTDTSFYIDDANRRSRLAELYIPHPESGAATLAPASLRRPERPSMLSEVVVLWHGSRLHAGSSMILNGGALDGERMIR